MKYLTVQSALRSTPAKRGRIVRSLVQPQLFPIHYGPKEQVNPRLPLKFRRRKNYCTVYWKAIWQRLRASKAKTDAWEEYRIRLVQGHWLVETKLSQNLAEARTETKVEDRYLSELSRRGWAPATGRGVRLRSRTSYLYIILLLAMSLEVMVACSCQEMAQYTGSEDYCVEMHEFRAESGAGVKPVEFAAFHYSVNYSGARVGELWTNEVAWSKRYIRMLLWKAEWLFNISTLGWNFQHLGGPEATIATCVIFD
ncbi:hypothetical protein B0H13DRAFT_1897714 [Mycena leptocephala]|nr:hypothetical protein B0H13DRAFT_1897714 [Mycena leptocephala]